MKIQDWKLPKYFIQVWDNDGQRLHQAVMFDGSYQTYMYENYDACVKDIEERIAKNATPIQA